MIFRLEKACSGSKRNESRLKVDIFYPKMLHKCPHAVGDTSNPIDGHRWHIDAHQKKLSWPSMPIDGIEWSLSAGKDLLVGKTLVEVVSYFLWGTCLQYPEAFCAQIHIRFISAQCFLAIHHCVSTTC